MDADRLRALLSAGSAPAFELDLEAVLGRLLDRARELTGARYAAVGVGEFTDDAEETAIVLADWAAVAIANARLHRAGIDRRAELERTNRALETTTEVARALSGVTDVDHVLELVVKRSRALLNVRTVEVALLEGDELVIAAVAGAGTEGLRGARLPADTLLADTTLESGRAQSFENVRPGSFARNALDARRALAGPLIHRGRTLGFLLALDRFEGNAPFTDDDKRLIEAFAAGAATAVVSAQTATDKGLRRGRRRRSRP